MDDGDESLVSRSRAGDRSAFEELVRRTGRMLFARIYLETGDTHRSEDLVQETFLHAWRSLHALSDAKVFRQWLNSIAHGVVVDAARYEARQKRGGAARQDENAMLQLADGRPTPAESSEQDEQRRHVLAVLRGLPQEYREVLTLRYLGGADYEMIARQLAISNGSLR